MAQRVENINPGTFQWAIERAGFELQEFLLHFPNVVEWMEGRKTPTVKQLEGFAAKVNLPFGYLFLPSPPKEETSFPFFRTGKKPTREVSLNVLNTVQMLEERQNWLIEHLKENGHDKLPYVGRFSVNSDYLEIVNDIRKTLKMPWNWAAQCPTWERALDSLAMKIEEAGIIVVFSGIVGNNTRRKIVVNECRGFVLVDEYAPFVFVNAADAKAAQMFTLIHELAHIWLGASAGFNIEGLMPSDDPIELLCDQVAAEFLVPEEHLQRLWLESQDFKKISRTFKVSPIVVARRALDLGLISKKKFFEFYNQYIRSFKHKKATKGSGGNFYATAKKRVSLRFAGFVHHAVKENKLLYRDAYRLTNLKGETYDRFVKEHLFQT